MLEVLLVLFIWVLLVAFVLYDTPKVTEAPTQPTATVSPSYWHWLDENYPAEDTAHYINGSCVNQASLLRR